MDLHPNMLPADAPFNRALNHGIGAIQPDGDDGEATVQDEPHIGSRRGQVRVRHQAGDLLAGDVNVDVWRELILEARMEAGSDRSRAKE
jgi:hypothetical protein